jgi:hypothetical protein
MVERALIELLAKHATVKLATSGGPVSPWIATAFFIERGPFELDVLIEARGKTLTNLLAEPRLALMLEDGNPVAPFAQASAHAIVNGSDRAAAERDVVAKTPSSAQLMAIPTLVPVRIVVDRWLVTHVAAGWLPARELSRKPCVDAHEQRTSCAEGVT